MTSSHPARPPDRAGAAVEEPAAGWRLVRRCRGRVLWADARRLLASRGGELWTSEDHGESWRRAGVLDLRWSDRLAALHSWGRRLRRRDVHWAADLGEDRFLLCAFRGFHSIDLRTGRARRLPEPWHGSRPLALCQRGKTLYYGEYRSNPDRSPIAIWRSVDGGEAWHRAWTFDSIRHVHGVYADPYNDALWVTTGDRDAEAGIWRTADDFRSLERVVGGSQALRVVQLLFTPTEVLFGSDAPDEINWLYRLNRQSGSIVAVQQVEGPVFYGFQAAGLHAFGTVVEPSRVNRTRAATVWWSTNEGMSWGRGPAFPKDRLPSRLFQYGQVLFPGGPGDGSLLWLTPYGAHPDQVSLCYERKR